MGRRERLDLGQRHLVVAADNRLPTQLADVAGQVIDERIVVVYQEDHARVNVIKVTAC